ncbi:MAG: PEP-CTERM/exosortase system-associated acyltransferase [Colwellia sp.]|jgi:N-acyl amino acid synthase of PEP-CTERM/exosortase system|uniref:PEP-CTERM/exosortase system-associated acyltransferase n=1 Tax=Colwellia sp. Bg11-12 TaxID=2759817 RepID=UPI0015F6A0FB|nr:PEP-CTERM/exosortase system-associated acyltransferase [Colwellia sp. Bg11-12]MBA6265156.1 PEP-CTERM/exosortase system-associated acyltransferase [Colwellia sp. Bg11-12]
MNTMALDINPEVDIKLFTQFLKPQYASTEDLRREVFKIRHNVYCNELAFENPKDDHMELDEFDPRSTLALIQHKPSDKYTGCVRIIHSNCANELLPIEKLCNDVIQSKDFNPQMFNRAEICEVSRLAVMADFRRFSGSTIGETNYSESELRSFPFIAIGLYMIACILMIEKGIKHAFVMMEPRLARSMKLVGIKFLQIGDPIQYHGLRAPYYISPEIFLENLRSDLKDLYKEIKKDIRSQF